ncbi:hypothetical protein G6F66_014959 [Rhizopus arrhizus]|nr:hypothetical protein G6F66_014959 [Rhizopus arrhizus]
MPSSPRSARACCSVASPARRACASTSSQAGAGCPGRGGARRRSATAPGCASTCTCSPWWAAMRPTRACRIASALHSSSAAGGRAMAGRSPGTLSSGISNQNVAPWPGVDCTPMRPCIRSMMRLQMARPRPVPP